MPRYIKIIIISFVLGFELILAVSYNPFPHGEIFSVAYRNAERRAAWVDYRQHPSPSTEARFQEEMYLMRKHEDWKSYTKIGLLATINIIGIWFFLVKFPTTRN